MTLRTALSNNKADEPVKAASEPDQSRYQYLADYGKYKEYNLEDGSHEEVSNDECSHSYKEMVLRVNNYFCLLAFL